MQQVDFTTLVAVVGELAERWTPARVETIYQHDRHTLSLALRTYEGRGWLTVSWHPQAARLHLDTPPPRQPDTFTLSEQLRHQLGGLALVAISRPIDWERLVDFQFAKRPGDPVLYHLFLEVMGKYSNVILTDGDKEIITTAHQVNERQSSARTVQTGRSYELPPALTEAIPSRQEGLARWQERISLIPGEVVKQLVGNYRGVSTALAKEMVAAAGIPLSQTTDLLTAVEWEALYDRWCDWIGRLAGEGVFLPVATIVGYSTIGWQREEAPLEISVEPAGSVSELLRDYYRGCLQEDEFRRLRHQLQQKLGNILAKLRVKADTFQQRLQQADGAEVAKDKADLLMANLHAYEVGMKSIVLKDFISESPVEIDLDPEKNAVQNAQKFYKQHQKLKRAKEAVVPLLNEVVAEVVYLEQVLDCIECIETYRDETDLDALREIREEAIDSGYLVIPDYRRTTTDSDSQPHRWQTPSGFELLIGRNNRQNERLSFRIANDYDLWFHAQEIAGSHGLLRLPPGAVAEEIDIQFAANAIAYYSRARQSHAVPVVYTKPKHIYKPKGAKLGTIIYENETIVWGYPQQLIVGDRLLE